MASSPRSSRHRHKRERTGKTLRADDAQEPRFLPLPAPVPVPVPSPSSTSSIHPPAPKPGSTPQTTQPNPLPPSVLPPSLTFLADTHALSTMSILSSSQIKQKVSALLKHLSPPEKEEEASERREEEGEVEKGAKPRLVVLHAKAPCAGKMVSVVEIAKREIAARDRDEGPRGRVYQYSRVGSELVELKAKGMGKGKGGEGREVESGKGVGGDRDGGRDGDGGGDGGGDGDGDGDGEEGGPAFEMMEVQERKKVRAVPVMTVFLCQQPVPALEELFGEQVL